MKQIKKFTGLLILIILAFNQTVPVTLGNETQVFSEPEKACVDLKPDYKKIHEEWMNNEKKNSATYEKVFQSAQAAHHDYVGCLFEFAEKKITEKNSKARDWLIPKQICLDPAELANVALATAPNQLIGPALQAHVDYKNYLSKLGETYQGGGREEAADGRPLGGSQQLMAKSAALGRMERQRQMEIDSAAVAIDLMFHSLKELRLAFVMHVHFQCTLNYLEKYRRALGELRRLIEPLPEQLRDASVTK